MNVANQDDFMVRLQLLHANYLQLEAYHPQTEINGVKSNLLQWHAWSAFLLMINGSSNNVILNANSIYKTEDIAKCAKLLTR